MKRKLFLAGLLVLAGAMTFAQNQQFEQFVGELERAANEYSSLANQITRNPDGDYTRQINSLQSRVNNIQSRIASWEIALAKSSSPQPPSERQQQRLLSALDKIQQAAYKIANALY